MSVRVDASVMPNLDAFDEEFAHGESHDESDGASAPPLKSRFRFSTVIGLALAAATITAVALAWPNLPGFSDPASEKPQAAVERLTRELDALRQENADLVQAHQQATERIAALEAAQQEQHTPFMAWYSEPAALSFGIGAHSEAGTTGRRSATARPRPREVPHRDETAPISLDPAQ